ncbi:MAG TPA: MMPL family transporter, partial [Thermoplasmata archaeon]
TTLPDDAPSSLAQAEIDRLFPNQTGGSESLLLMTGADVTGPSGQATVLALTRAITSDPNVTHVASVTTLYSAYQSYLLGNAQIASVALGAAFAKTPPLTAEVNGSALLLWGPTSSYVATWTAMVAAHPTTPASDWNFPAYNATRGSLGGNATEGFVLQSFYDGPPPSSLGSVSGFNGTADCAQDPSSVVACAENVTRAAIGSVVPNLVPDPAGQPVPYAVLADLGLGNFSSTLAQHRVVVAVVAGAVGLPLGWVALVDGSFPNGSATAAQRSAWTAGVVAAGSPSTYPLPIPAALASQFVDPTNDAELLLVGFDVPDSFLDSNRTNPVFASIDEIGRLVPGVLASTDPAGTFAIVQTGGGPLDQTEGQVLASSLAVLLPLTVLVLIGITMVYFRAPLTPVLTFGGLGIALVLGLAGVVLIGKFVTHVDSTALTLQNTFVLGVGTDYSIFLVARYREELWGGAAPHEALVTTVTWAGQSIATSGATAIIATLALAFSGVALLSQWGLVLSLAVLIAVLVSLTFVPALLVLVGPRVFWPNTGERFRRRAEVTVARRREEKTYFFRVARGVRRRPWTVIGLTLLVSIPLFFVALTAPISYDFFGQLPGGHPATDGLVSLSDHFGAGRAFPTLLLVTFASPLVVGSAANASEFTDLASLTQVVNSTDGVASVDSLLGGSGAPLNDWVGFASLPPARQALLNGTLGSFVGDDHRTVWLTVYSSTGGLSAGSVQLLGRLQSTVADFDAAHPSVVHVAFGGGAATTSDLQRQTALATQRLLIGVSIGLIIVLLAVLRSALIPLLAVATIGLSIGWAWGISNLVLGDVFGFPMFYFVPTVLIVLVLGLGIDYNIFLLTRIREERIRGRTADEATVHGVASTGGIITAAAVILASAFGILAAGDFTLLRAIGFSVATAVLLDAMVVRTYLVPAALFVLGERVWRLPGWRR